MNKLQKSKLSMTIKVFIITFMLLASVNVFFFALAGSMTRASVSLTSDVTYEGILIYEYNTSNNTASVKVNPNRKDFSGSIVIPEAVTSEGTTYSVTSVASSGFRECSNMTGVTLPSSITTINSSAFYQCTSLTAITIPSSVTSIGNFAFSGCSKLSSVTLSEGLKTIGDQSFASCKNLTTIKIPKSVTSIEGSTFDYCTNLATITVTSGNTKYTSYSNAIYEGTKLIIGGKNSTIKSDTTEIGYSAFCGRGITSITIPESVLTIEKYAFQGSSLTSATFKNTEGWKAGSTVLTSTELSSASTSAKYLKTTYYSSTWTCDPVKNYSYYDMLQFELIVGDDETDENVKALDGTLRVFSAEDTDGNKTATGIINIPAKVIWTDGVTREVTMVKRDGFNGCTGITVVNFPNTMQIIDKESFRHTAITSIKIPESVISIGTNSFSDTSNVVEITVDSKNTVYYAEDNAIYLKDEATLWHGSKGMTAIKSGTTKIGIAAFEGAGISSITLLSTITDIGAWAFNGCNMTSITIPASCEYIGDHAFNECSSLTSATFENTSNWVIVYTGEPLSATDLANSTTAATYLTDTYMIQTWMRRALTDVELDKFIFTYNESTLTATLKQPTDRSGISGSVYIPSQVRRTKDADGNLYAEKDIKTYTVTSIADWAFSQCYNITSVIIPNTVTTIGASSFNVCRAMTSITLPEGLMLIGDHAFSGCSGLTSLTIPASVVNIDAYAFNDCTNATFYFGDRSDWWYFYEPEEKSRTVGTFPSAGMTYTELDENFGVFPGWTLTKYPTVSTLTDFTFTVLDSDAKTMSVKAKNTDITGTSNVLTIPRFVLNDDGDGYIYTVTDIPFDAFYQCENITAAYIHQDVTSISSTAFLQCPIEKYYVHPDNPTYSIGNDNYAIYSGSTLAFGTKNIGTILEGTTIIGENAFRDTGLKSITLPDSVRVIEGMAFQNTGLTSITIPDNVMRIGTSAFYNTQLTSAIFPVGSVWKVNSNTFDVATATDYKMAVRLVDSVYGAWRRVIDMSIYDGVLVFEVTDSTARTASVKAASTNISGDINIPAFVYIDGEIYKTTSIPANGFKDCTGITHIYIASGQSYERSGNITSIGESAFENCTGLKYVITGNSVTSIGKRAFANCYSLTEIPSSWNGESYVTSSALKTIDYRAFYNCTSLKEVNFHGNLTLIKGYAFEGCSNLTTVYLRGSGKWNLYKYDIYLDNIVSSEAHPNMDYRNINAATALKSTYVEYSWMFKGFTVIGDVSVSH